jgi:phosphoribosylanthranilate isomerase
VIHVKICGITRVADGRLAASLGAAAIGFVFWPRSPRLVSLDVARELARALPPFVARVGVFVDASPEVVQATVAHVGLDVVQLHGDERVEDYASVGARLIKTVPLDRDSAVADADALPAHVVPLVDAADRVKRGGTGQRAHWPRAARLAGLRPIVLAGGLDADTVGDAIDVVRPMALDVSSGVESAPGIKSEARLRALFDAIASATSSRRSP